MEPNKIENQIREKLNSRKIQPSAQSWDRLDAMLSVAEEKKTRRPFGFLFIAASILVLVTLGLFFFTQKGKDIQPQNDVVNTEIKKDTIQNPINNQQTPVIIQKQENQVVVATENKSTISNQQSTINNQRVSINNQKTTNNQKQSNPLINHDKQIEFQNSSDIAVKELPKTETKNEIAVGANNNKSDDFLLAGLDNTANQSANKKSSVKVDAKSLLSQVDGELELSFREKVINSVSKNYKEIKVALANRNQE